MTGLDMASFFRMTLLPGMTPAAIAVGPALLIDYVLTSRGYGDVPTILIGGTITCAIYLVVTGCCLRPADRNDLSKLLRRLAPFFPGSETERL